MQTKKSFWNRQNLFTATAVIVSLCALIVSVVQTRIMKQQQEAAVWPFVRWGVFRAWASDTTGNFQISITNSGIGPAIIEKVTILYDEKYYSASDIQEVINNMMKDCFNGELKAYSSQSVEQIVLPANEAIKYIEITDRKLAAKMAQAFEGMTCKMKNFDIIIQYRDVYNNHWTVNGKSKI